MQSKISTPELELATDPTRKELMETLATGQPLIIDDLGMFKLPRSAADELLEIVMRRYERTSTLLTSNRGNYSSTVPP